MVTYYVVYNPFLREFLAAGRGRWYTNNINFAKHFTSQWSAENHIKRDDKLGGFIVKRIERY